jgi:hypothetical protein
MHVNDFTAGTSFAFEMPSNVKHAPSGLHELTQSGQAGLLRVALLPAGVASDPSPLAFACPFFS